MLPPAGRFLKKAPQKLSGFIPFVAGTPQGGLRQRECIVFFFMSFMLFMVHMFFCARKLTLLKVPMTICETEG